MPYMAVAVLFFTATTTAQVIDFYKTSGRCQQLARKKSFENITLGVIMFNAAACLGVILHWELREMNHSAVSVRRLSQDSGKTEQDKQHKTFRKSHWLLPLMFSIPTNTDLTDLRSGLPSIQTSTSPQRVRRIQCLGSHQLTSTCINLAFIQGFIQGSFRFPNSFDQAVSAVMFWVVYFLLRYFEIMCDILWLFIAQFCWLSVWQVFIVAEHVFCTYFFLEWWIRFGAFESKRSLAASSKIRALITSDPTDDQWWFPTLGHPQIMSNMVAICCHTFPTSPFAFGNSSNSRQLSPRLLVALWWFPDVRHRLWARDPRSQMIPELQRRSKTSDFEGLGSCSCSCWLFEAQNLTLEP